MGALAIIGAIGGFIKGVGGAIASDQEWKEKKKELQRKRDDLDSSWNSGRKDAIEEANDKINSLQSSIRDTEYARSSSLNSSARNSEQQQEIDNMQLAELQVQAKEAEGSAVQSVAVSGVRRMTDDNGNVMNAPVFRTNQASVRSQALAKAQANLSRQQSFESARASYLDSTLNMESYRRQVDDTKRQLSRTLSSYDLSYQQNRNDINYDLDYMNSKKGESLHQASIFGNWVTSIFSGFSLGL